MHQPNVAAQISQLSEAFSRIDGQLEILLWAAGGIIGAVLALGTWLVLQRIRSRSTEIEHSMTLRQVGSAMEELRKDIAQLRENERQTWQQVSQMHSSCEHCNAYRRGMGNVVDLGQAARGKDD